MNRSVPRHGTVRCAVILCGLIMAFCGWRSARAQDAAELRTFTLDRSAPIRRVTVGATKNREGTRAIAATERLAYSNTLGRFAAKLPAGFWIADDLTLIAADGCALREFSFQVTGRPDPAGCDGGPCGPFGVEFALYDACPGAGGQIISGTAGAVSFDDDGTYEVGVIIPTDTEIEVSSRVWLWLRMSVGTAGVIFGAPALTGFSDDAFDFLGFPCNASVGGFPRNPHASFNAEVYVDAVCATGFPSYQNIRAANSGLNAGAGVCLADDIRLDQACDMLAVEIGVRNRGLYDLELRNSVGGDPVGACNGSSDLGVYGIPGTWKRFVVTQDGISIRRFLFDPPISLPLDKLWVVVTMNNTSGQWILTRRDAAIGDTESSYAVYESGAGWYRKFPTDNTHGGMHVVITCAGEPPVGACCDVNLPDEDGEATCREVPKINCSSPTNEQQEDHLGPDWLEGATCHSDPFPHACGLAACCTPDGGCENLTRNECEALEPIDAPRIWQLGQFCAEGAQDCPPVACLVSEGECLIGHDQVGCRNPYCCVDVCEIDPWCCDFTWDRECVRTAGDVCHSVPSNDRCAGDRGQAHELAINTSTVFDNRGAQFGPSDEGLPCHLGKQPVCDNDRPNGAECDFDFECEQGQECPDRVLTPGRTAFSTVWFKFTAGHTSARLSLCQTDPFLDSLMQVFSVSDPTDNATACASLSPIACSDDSASCAGVDRPGCIEGRHPTCPGRSRQAAMCAEDLVPGETYYVMIGSKREEDAGVHQLDIESPCPPPGIPVANDYCDTPAILYSGFDAFDLARASKSPPDDESAQPIDRDVWFRIGGSGYNWLSVETCGYTAELTPDTTMILYDDCDCPVSEENIVAVSTDVGGACGLGSRVTMNNLPGHCYKIRLGDGAGDTAAGRIAVIPIARPSCPPLAMAVIDPPDGVIDARRPHPADDPASLEGIGHMFVRVDDPTLREEELPFDETCWTLCETAQNVDHHPPFPPSLISNGVISVRRGERGGSYELVLKRPITPGEATTLLYTDANGVSEQMGRLTALPGDVSADGYVSPSDVLFLIDVLNRRPGAGPSVPDPPWGDFSIDVDHNSDVGAADILALIDLLNGAGAYEPWMNASIPDGDAHCP